MDRVLLLNGQQLNGRANQTGTKVLAERQSDKTVKVILMRHQRTHFYGALLVVSSGDYPQFQKFLDAVNKVLASKVPLITDISNVYQVDGTPILSIKDLKNGCIVVCCCSQETFVYTNYTLSDNLIKQLGCQDQPCVAIRRKELSEDQRPVKIRRKKLSESKSNEKYKRFCTKDLPSSITTFIRIKEKLFSGNMSCVFVGRSKKRYHHGRYVIKMVDTFPMHMAADNSCNELEITRKLQFHPNIVKLWYAVEKNFFLYLVLEQLDSDVHDLARRGVSKQLAAHIMRDVANGLQYMHSKNIIHRDIKPANLLVHHNKKLEYGMSTKIADFGLATEYNGKRLYLCCGTLAYMPPEMVKKSGYDHAVDCWSLGITLYYILYKHEPFVGYGRCKMLRLIVESAPKIPGEADHCKNLLLSLLDKNPNRRLTAAQLLKHPFLKEI